MKHPRSYQRRSASANRSDYEPLFIRRVHDLIKWGYDRLCASAYATEEETDITGDLAEAIENILIIQMRTGCGTIPSMTIHQSTSRLQQHEEKGKGAGGWISSSLRPMFRRAHTSVLKRNVWGRETQFRGILVRSSAKGTL
jgi:hypothetical protein